MADSRDLQINVGVNDQASSKMSKLGDTIKGSFDKISLGAGVALAAITGFAGSALNNFADAGEHIANLSAQTGISASALSAMKVTADEMGLSIETVTGSIKKMQVGLETLGKNSDKADAALKPLGINFKEIKGLAPEEQLFQIGNAIAGIKDPAERTAQAVKFFGKSGTELIPFFEGGKASLADFTKHAKDMGLVFDDVAANKAAALDAAMDNLKSSMAGATMQIAGALAPAITSIVEKITPFLTQLSDWISKNPELTTQIIAWTAGLLGAAAVISPLIGTIQALGAALMFLSANPIVIIIAAIAALIGYFVWLYNTNEDFRRKVDEVWTLVTGKINAAGLAIGTFIKTKWTEIYTFWSGIWAQISGTVMGIWDAISGFITTGIQGIQKGITSGMGTINGLWAGFWDTFKSVVDGVVNTINGYITTLVGNIGGAIKQLQNLTAAAGRGVSSGVGTFASVGNSIGNALNLNNYRASGGPVSAGTPYIVGEQGQELFVPNQSGTIIPNGQFGGGGGAVNIYVTGNQLLDENAGVRIGDEIMRALRMNQRLS